MTRSSLDMFRWFPFPRTPVVVLYVCAYIGLKIILQIGVRNHSGLECSHSTELDKNAIRHSDPKSSPYEKEKAERGGVATLSPRFVRIECAVHCLENCNPEVVQLVQ